MIEEPSKLDPARSSTGQIYRFTDLILEELRVLLALVPCIQGGALVPPGGDNRLVQAYGCLGFRVISMT